MGFSKGRKLITVNIVNNFLTVARTSSKLSGTKGGFGYERKGICLSDEAKDISKSG
jgi:hypothetical protein